ncbi:hypothetical protein [Sphingomonas faeni]|uniref:hypothetical protein n=1 Tax=Sphingomonas faeni TaxID=185950 RepID=UPI002412EE6F|nr:hypothetical protein [Sphingomonas faeni]
MTSAQRRYLATEAAIGATISAVLSIGFVLLMFGHLNRVAIAGTSGLIVDAVPQGAAIALMATLVPTLLTRRRLALGKVCPVPQAGPGRVSHLPVRALAMAATGAAITTALTAMLLVAGIADLPLAAVLAGKTIWGLLLGGVVAWTMTHAAIEQR